MRVAENASIASRIEQAFQTASTSTGTSFDYLVKTAARESAFNPTAKARTSSATGLFQFIESTWLETMKESGAQFGLDKYADQIQRSARGKYTVSDPRMRKQILDMRNDPEISSLMAGAFTQKNAAYLNRKLGRDPTDGELYMAHFLGAHGASRLIESSQLNSAARADKLFPAQAKANRSIFYHSDGHARTTAEVYASLSSRHDAVTRVAGVAGHNKTAASQTVAVTPERKPQVATQTASAQSQETETQAAYRRSRVFTSFQVSASEEPFESLFRNSDKANSSASSERIASAFAAVTPQQSYGESNLGNSALSAQELASRDEPVKSEKGPLDLTRFLSYAVEAKKKDIIPPV